MDVHLLESVELAAGMLWVDEFNWRPVESVSERAVTGQLVVDVAERIDGRPITLEATDSHGWITRATLQALYGLAEAQGAAYTFEHADGRSFTVMFAPGGEPITARPIERPELPLADWPYVVTLRLIEVTAP